MLYDHLVTDGKYVLCGPCALARAGLVTYSKELLFLQTKYKELDGVCTIYITYWFYSRIDYDYCVSPSAGNPLILQPSKERAVIEYLKNEKWCDEGILIEALKTYLMWFWDDKKLYECADHFGVARDTVDYWLNEALTDEEV